MIKHYHSKYHFTSHSSATRHFSSSLIVLIGTFGILFFAFHFLTPLNLGDFKTVSLWDIFLAGYATVFRLLIAYFLALVFSIPLVLITTSNPKLEKLLLPIFDILQSVPALAFFPVIVLLFIKFNFFEGAAIFVLFMSMLWNLVFAMIGGIKVIPNDIKSSAAIFGARGWKKLYFVFLPAIFPYLVTGSLLAWGSSWTIIIVAEVLHNFIPNASSNLDLLGLGSLLTNAAYSGNNFLFVATLLFMILIISILNFFVWQKLLHISERFKFE